MCSDLHCVRMALASCWKMLMEGRKQESREVAGAEEKMRGDEGWGQTDGSRDTQVMDSLDISGRNDSIISQASIRKWERATC